MECHCHRRPQPPHTHPPSTPPLPHFCKVSNFSSKDPESTSGGPPRFTAPSKHGAFGREAKICAEISTDPKASPALGMRGGKSSLGSPSIDITRGKEKKGEERKSRAFHSKSNLGFWKISFALAPFLNTVHHAGACRRRERRHLHRRASLCLLVV